MSPRHTHPPRVSILDIAQRAGVSPATVSRAFNAPDLVQDRTRAAILEIAADLGYRPNASARTLRTLRSKVVGIVLPTLNNPVFAECLQGMAGASARLGYAIMPVTTQYRLDAEQDAVNELMAFGVDGVVLVVSDAASSKAIPRLKTQGVPYVLAYNRHPAHPCVSVAGEDAMYEIVQGLVNMGHQRIAMICGRLRASDRAQQRLAGFSLAMERLGLDPFPLIEVPFVETAIREIADALSRSDRPTALVCSNDLLAMRAMRAAYECGLRIPDDLSITGFDGITLGADLTPSLSTVVQPNAQMGWAAVDWLVRDMDRHTRPDASASITLEYRIRWAESCASAPSTACIPSRGLRVT